MILLCSVPTSLLCPTLPLAVIRVTGELRQDASVQRNDAMDYEAVSLSLQMAMMVIALAMLSTVLERS